MRSGHKIIYGSLEVEVPINANSTGILVDQLDTTNNPVAVEINNDGTNYGLYIKQDGISATATSALYIYSNVAQTNARLVQITQQNSSSTWPALAIENDGTGAGVVIDQIGNGIALYIDNDGTNHGININQDEVLATDKSALYVYSNAAQINSSLVKINQANAASDQRVLHVLNIGTGDTVKIHNGLGATGSVLAIEQDATGHGVIILQDGVQTANHYALSVNSESIQINSALVYFNQDNLSSTADLLELNNDGTGHGIYIHQDGVLAANKSTLYIYSNVAQTASELVEVHQDNASSTATMVNLKSDGTGVCLGINQNGSGNAVILANLGTKLGMKIDQIGVLDGSSFALYVYSNAAQTNQGMVAFQCDHASSTKQVVNITNDGTGAGLWIDQNGLAPCVELNNDADGAHIRFTGDPTISSPIDGDLWFDGTNLYFRVGAVTKTISWT